MAYQENSSNSLREQIQTQIVELITKGLEQGSISEDRARSIAKLVLEKLPEGINNQELMQVLPQLDNEFAELSDVVIPIIVEYEERIRSAVEAKVLKLVREQKFSEAVATARKGIEFAKQIGSPQSWVKLSFLINYSDLSYQNDKIAS